MRGDVPGLKKSSRYRPVVVSAHQRGCPRQPLQLQRCLAALVVVCALLLDDRLELGTLGGVLRYQLGALELALNHALLCHGPTPYFLNGKFSALSSARPSSSVLAVVVMVTSRPRIRSILSYSISGKMICSRTPME